ncbi:hypothetical protein L3X38_033071 [Prunus dulcis]|uniref:Uncharacterized protein n=1 Tax=Prunus dulcis TaxID=3755 RepID=A0AAD4VGE5_PRUDU|nr:hypothetical protein L3X38_033071 [Prunus dulcis]
MKEDHLSVMIDSGMPKPLYDLLFYESDDLLRCSGFNRLGFYPFGEIICSYNDETVLLAASWIDLANEVHCPSSKRSWLDY